MYNGLSVVHLWYIRCTSVVHALRPRLARLETWAGEVFPYCRASDPDEGGGPGSRGAGKNVRVGHCNRRSSRPRERFGTVTEEGGVALGFPKRGWPMCLLLSGIYDTLRGIWKITHCLGRTRRLLSRRRPRGPYLWRRLRLRRCRLRPSSFPRGLRCRHADVMGGWSSRSSC
jgi:hypothetical protein